MNSIRKRILTALWVAGAFAGLLAIIVLPGRWDRGGSVEAHTIAGVEIIDTLANCVTHNLDIGTNEVQTITITGTPTGGTFTLSYKGQTTGTIVFNAASSVVVTALEALSTIAQVSATGGALPGAAVVVTFEDPGGQDVALMTGSATGLTGGTPVLTITQTTAGVQGDCVLPASANADAHPSHYLNADVDPAVTGNDAIVVTPGTEVTVVVHVRTGAADAGNGTNVDFTATGLANLTEWSRDTDDNGDLDGANAGANDGVLFDGADAQNITADTVSDTDAAADGTCTASGDTCIDGATVQTGKKANPDGIAIVKVKSTLATSSTITASALGSTDTLTIIWVGPQASLTLVTLDDEALALTPPLTVPEDVIAQDPDGTGAGGDNDLALVVSVSDAAGLPVAGETVLCTVAPATPAQANIGAVAEGPVGVYTFILTGKAGNVKGDLTVTCWAEKNANATLDTPDEQTHSASATVRVAGGAATVDLGADVKVAVGSVALSAQVTDNTGGGVADGTICAWNLIDPAAISALIGPTLVTADGKVSSTLFVSGAGTVSVLVTCDSSSTTNVTGSLVVQVNADGVGVFPPGDLNCDGDFTVADLLAAARALVGLDPALTAC